MRDEYDFSNARKNPYTKLLKSQITINVSDEAIGYFKGLAQTTGIPYQTLINLYLTDCAKKRLAPDLSWS